MGATIRAGDGDGFVEVAEEAFDADGFVIAARSRVETDAKEGTSIGKNAAKSTASINDDEAAHADFEKDLLEEKTSEFMSVCIADRDADNELGEVAHSG
jgi:hypothetical protein